jgi:glucosamine-6-phosphate deaminase
MNQPFRYQPSLHVPFRDMAQLERCRKISRAEIERHPNPDFRIRVLPGDELEFIWITDIYRWIKQSDEANQRVVLILPNPCPSVYRKVAHLINTFSVSCRNLHVFAMDEYANEEARVAPVEWEFGLVHSMMREFYDRLREDLRPPRTQFRGPTTENISSYGKMISDLGEADACYSGPGWTGHVAFIEPGAAEFHAPLEEWRHFGPRICTLSPYTLAQNSLHGSFGMSGDIAAVPPKAATIGPAQVIAAKSRLEFAGITVHGTATAWQRMIARLCYHGPVTPLLPSSIHQQLRTDCYISELIAQDIKPDWSKGY